MTTLLNPYFGEFGGMYVPQILMPALRQLEEAFVSAQKDPEFQAQLNDLLKNYAGRPTALTKCQNITAGTNTTLYLKREDLLHGGAHKTNRYSVRLYWRSGWVKLKLLPKPVPVSMAWRRPLPAPCSA
ncbi:hypothetical protein [Escherichia coli]|uniref:hypothetical protein n=1 Tax=Escherichia coli TaxID=562 RepID=UPI00388F372D